MASTGIPMRSVARMVQRAGRRISMLGSGVLLGLFLPATLVAQDVASPCDSEECCRQAEGAELHGEMLTADLSRIANHESPPVTTT